MQPQLLVGWALAVAAIAIGWVQWGWPGVVLAITVIAFWLLLQFSRALRVLRTAGQAPVGHVASAAMLNAKLHKGMRLPQILALTKSLGQKIADDPETFEWTDPGGDRVRLELRQARLALWTYLRRYPTDA
ncbi:MAG: hypothetical protein JNJ42_10890 [Burkholderiaceae bacterium]|nr:hypothetical protein [Burkholderiaceae bacterium]